MSFTDLDRNLSTPPRSPSNQGNRGPLSIFRPSTSHKSISHGLTSPISPVSLPSGLQVTRGNSRDSIGLAQHLSLQEQGKSHGPLVVHSSTSHGPYPPPVSPKRKAPANVHSRILQDNTRIDTPRPTITSSSPTAAPFVQSGISSSSAGPTNNRVLGNQRPGDQDRRVLSPPTNPPQFSPVSSRNQFARHPQEGNTSNNSRVSVERSILASHTFTDSEGSRPNGHETTPLLDTPSPPSYSSSGMTASSSSTFQDQEHDYDMMVRHLSQQIFNISSNVAVLERLVPCLGQRHKDTKDMRASLHAVLDTTQELVKSASTQVKLLARYHLPPSSPNATRPIISTFSNLPQQTPTDEASAWQRKVLASRRLTHQRLTKDLALVSKAFQELQRQVVEAERRHVATLRRLSTSASLQRHNLRSDLMDLSQSDIEAGVLDLGSAVMGEGGAPFAITVVPRAGRAMSSSTGVLVHDRELSAQEEALLQELLVMDGELAIQESILQERESEIQRIEQGMGQVLEVMRELGVLVHEQRGGVDFLQDNILQTRGRTQLAQQEVLKASEYQRQSREKLCFMVLIASVVGAIVAFVLM